MRGRRRRTPWLASILVVVAVAMAGLAVWQARPGGRWHVGGPIPEPATSRLDAWFEAAEFGDVTVIERLRDEGVAVDATDPFGRTASIVAAAGGHDDVLWTLLSLGAEVDVAADDGTTALIAAAASAPPSTVLILLNSGANPVTRDASGRNAVDVGADNPALRRSGLWPRLVELTESSPVVDGLRGGARYLEGWPSAYVVPIEGATISSRRSHLPGALRAYRNGIHEGFDFYDGTVSVAIDYGTPQRAVASGTVVRADHEYVEFDVASYRSAIEIAATATTTPEDVLDRLRGRQVWIEHAGGFVSRYAHLAGIPADVVVGSVVGQGSTIAFTGNSGTLEAAEGTQDDPHPHVEIWNATGSYLGEGRTVAEIYALAAQLFGFESLPPYTDGGLSF